MKLLSELYRELTDLAFPDSCLICQNPFDRNSKLQNHSDQESFCDECRKLFVDQQETCPRCSSTVGAYVELTHGCMKCRDLKFHFDSAVRFGPYAGPLRELVLKMKHSSGECLTHALGIVWAYRILHLKDQIDIVAPVPLHWWRQWRRGYNQSEALAIQIGNVLGKPTRRLLKRIKSTVMQTSIEKKDRFVNVRGVFAAKAKCQNMRVLLVDDVLTTGATCSEAARILKQAGATEVLVAAFTHQ